MTKPAQDHSKSTTYGKSPDSEFMTVFDQNRPHPDLKNFLSSGFQFLSNEKMTNQEIDRRSFEILEAMENHREQLGGKVGLPDSEIDIAFLIQKIASLQLAIEQLVAPKRAEPRVLPLI